MLPPKRVRDVSFPETDCYVGANGDDVLMSAAKRYRVDAEKLQKAVVQEFAAKLQPEEETRCRDSQGVQTPWMNFAETLCENLKRVSARLDRKSVV